MTAVQKEAVLSFEEVADRYHELIGAGREDEAVALFDKFIPILPHLAQTAKRIMGAEALRDSGMNLTDAFKMFGDDWLDRDD